MSRFPKNVFRRNKWSLIIFGPTNMSKFVNKEPCCKIEARERQSRRGRRDQEETGGESSLGLIEFNECDLGGWLGEFYLFLIGYVMSNPTCK